MLRSKFAKVQCAFAVAKVRKVTANLSQTCGFPVAKHVAHLFQFCGICGCRIEFNIAVPSTGCLGPVLFENIIQNQEKLVVFTAHTFHMLI